MLSWSFLIRPEYQSLSEDRSISCYYCLYLVIKAGNCSLASSTSGREEEHWYEAHVTRF
jgi:hypothetical protein